MRRLPSATTLSRPIRSNRTHGLAGETDAFVARQSKSLPLEPRNPHLLSSAVDARKCDKMAHRGPRGGEGGCMEGERRGNGGGKVGLRGHREGPPVCHFGTQPTACSKCQ